MSVIASSHIYPLYIEDIFGIIQDSKKDTTNSITSSTKVFENLQTLDYVKQIMKTHDIAKLNINWSVYLHEFYKNHMIFTDDLKKCILNNTKKILSSSNNDDLKNFILLNSLFEILNELNASHDQSYDCKNYTLLRCQDLYVNYLTEDSDISKNLISNWFTYLYNNVIIYDDSTTKNKYQRNIVILGKYLTHQNEYYDNNISRNEQINKFIDTYSNWSGDYLIKEFNSNRMDLSHIFEKLNKIDKINELFISTIDRSNYLKNTIITIVPLWDEYLKTVLCNNLSIDNNIIKSFNSINLSNTNFDNFTIKFIECWQNKFRFKCKPESYGDLTLFDDIIKISPLISIFKDGHNKKEFIIKYLTNIYNFDSNLLGYIIIGLNFTIKNLYNDLLQSNNSFNKFE